MVDRIKGKLKKRKKDLSVMLKQETKESYYLNPGGPGHYKSDRLLESFTRTYSLNCFRSRLNVLWKNIRTNSVLGATIPDQNQKTTKRMHIQAVEPDFGVEDM